MTFYRDAGVDQEAGQRLVDKIAPSVSSTWTDTVVGPFGGFAAGFRLPPGYKQPVLMMTTDGVGTKAEVARIARQYDGIGQDLVAMCVDDLAATGARPLAMTDYLTVGNLVAANAEAIIRSVADACRAAGCALLGGETAEHPGVMELDQFDLGGAALGIVEYGAEITGADIRPGDRVVAVASPNLRANGFSLIRALVLPHLSLDEEFPDSGHSVADVLLAPSIIYAPAVLDAIASAPIHGLAHITGGGIAGNVSRILPAGSRAIVETASWQPPPVFDVIARLATVPIDEMFETFNMGVGFVAVVPEDSVDPVVTAFAVAGHDAWDAGYIDEGDGSVFLAGVD